MNEYRQCNKYLRRDIYFLENVEIEFNPKDETIPDAKSIVIIKKNVSAFYEFDSTTGR
jgi:hypothetical protein